MPKDELKRKILIMRNAPPLSSTKHIDKDEEKTLQMIPHKGMNHSIMKMS